MKINEILTTNESFLNKDLLYQIEYLALVDNIEHDFALTFIDDVKFLDKLKDLKYKTTLLIKTGLEYVNIPENIHLIETPDPRLTFYELHNALSQYDSKYDFETRIDKSALINDKAQIDEYGVVIGKNTRIDAFTTIRKGTTIGNHCVIQAGSKIGESGFEFKRTTKGILEVVHDAGVTIGNNVQIGANSTIGKGFLGKDTVIGDNTKIDFGVSVAHRSEIGKEVFIAAGVVVSGNVKLGSNSWVGPSATLSSSISIGERSFIALGSVVVANFPANSRLMGVPARKV